MDARKGDATPKYGLGVVIGAGISLFWPWVIGFVLGRRAKSRHDRQVDREIDHKLAEERTRRGHATLSGHAMLSGQATLRGRAYP